jgi:hypothetical protein
MSSVSLHTAAADRMMSLDEQSRYREERAQRELDLGLTAGSIGAARAHLTLSSLHLQRMRSLGDVLPERRPPCIM